jgi:signal transduction histidine kinase
MAIEIQPAGSIPGSFRFLQVEDNVLDVELVQRELRRAGFVFTAAVVQTPEDFTREVRAHCPHVVLADYNLPHWRGIEALKILESEGLDIPLILVTGALGEVTAVDCLKQGATDYVLKGALTRLPTAIRRALQEKKLREQRRKAEEALAEKAEELARSNKELEQFAYIASHDLQEPLRMVASYTELLGERYRGKLDDKADKYIGYAVDGARRMQGLINDLLAYARVGSRAKPMEATDPSAVLALVITGLRKAIEGSHAEIVATSLPTVLADDVQLGQVFQNLIANAIKFRHPEHAPQIRVWAELEGEMVRFCVADNGIGMEKESTGRIFQMFQRLHTREEYEGTGIGLAVAKKVVERHGGQIWFDSAPGEGTTFYFTLPAAAAVNTEKELDVQAAASAAGGG